MPKTASKHLLAKSDEIMRQWEKRANKEVLAALQMESLALRNSLPELLSLIAHVLSTTSKRSDVRNKWEHDEGVRVGKKHGQERADTHTYTIGQMIFEYHILRQVICDVMEEDHALRPIDREVIVCMIEQAVNDASTQFSDTVKEAQERLAAALTHDLRGPLTVASLANQRILRQPDNADYCIKAATRIRRSLSRLELMIQSLLDVSRLQSGKKMNLHLEPFHLGELAHELTEDFNMLYDGRLTLTSNVSGIVHWDKAEIIRLLENLTNNAAKYGTPKTPISVFLGEDAAGIILKIHNEGAVIPREEQDGLFKQFQRGKAPQQHKGWGIGLTVVQGIVLAHRGHIHIESTQGAGTTFIVNMPKDARKQDERGTV